jgi:hypothetical protein
MTKDKPNGWALKALWGVVVTTFLFMGSGVIANDNRNSREHTEIRSEMINRDEKMMDSLHKFDVRQEVLIQAVNRIEKKL